SIIIFLTYKTEFLGQTQVTKEVIWLRRLLNKLNMNQDKAIIIICSNNQGAIILSLNL
ncbi:hypothetical protein ASPTUDRAFT_129894, partial [Aspergillus tubingensis CBS 134.48]